MEKRDRILIVDDEPQLTRVLRTGLKSHGYDVRVAADGQSGLEAFGDWQPDLLLTDLAMPNVDGLELCRRVRAVSQIPIIVLSAKGEEKTKVEALDIGADDYVTKPFGIDELLARVRAALRRASTSIAKEPASTVLEVNDFRVDLESRSVTVEGRDIHLTPKEFDLLVYFINNAGKVLTHRTLLSAIWGGNYVEQSEYLRVFVGQLRKKIEPDASKPHYILTEPWVGYRFEPDGSFERASLT
ncbi:MAG: two-component system, OmpR family, operon response regulator KdpE [Acidobacteriota bacterium]|jgi:two-component system KDP operon response regulator KdpE|nr:two-component system, OmpR family, operon response regulator KdpE [Acidobacteriota bacterium]